LFSLIVPFLRFGEVITGSGHFPLTSDAFKKVITGQASKDVMLSIVHAVSKQTSSIIHLADDMAIALPLRKH
jgi:hypothetical protein